LYPQSVIHYVTLTKWLSPSGSQQVTFNKYFEIKQDKRHIESIQPLLIFARAVEEFRFTPSLKFLPGLFYITKGIYLANGVYLPNSSMTPTILQFFRRLNTILCFSMLV